MRFASLLLLAAVLGSYLAGPSPGVVLEVGNAIEVLTPDLGVAADVQLSSDDEIFHGDSNPGASAIVHVAGPDLPTEAKERVAPHPRPPRR